MTKKSDRKQSAEIFSRVLNLPLYDGNCSPAAREHLAAHHIEAAINDWRRLAELGSGRARCILSYISLKGTPSLPGNREEAKRIALTALTGDRGYAGYLLGSILLQERQIGPAAKYFIQSAKSGFPPAIAAWASLRLASSGSSKRHKAEAIDLFRRAIREGHIPARVMLAKAFLSGHSGPLKRFLGLALVPLEFIRMAVGLRYGVFSISSFFIIPNSKSPLFKTQPIAPLRRWPH